MLLATAQLFALYLGFLLTQPGQCSQIDWHGTRGLSFWQLGLRQLQCLCYQGLPIPPLRSLPRFDTPTGEPRGILLSKALV
jgi:hypothetical protein